MHHPDENSLVVASRPVGQAAVGLRATYAGIKFPQQGARSGIEREYFLRGGDAVEDAVNNNGAGLQAPFFPGIETPGNLKLFHIAATDLRQAGVVVVLRRATVDRPIAVVLGQTGSGEQQRKRKERQSFQFFTGAERTEDSTALADSSNRN